MMGDVLVGGIKLYTFMVFSHSLGNSKKHPAKEAPPLIFVKRNIYLYIYIYRYILQFFSIFSTQSINLQLQKLQIEGTFERNIGPSKFPCGFSPTFWFQVMHPLIWRCCRRTPACWMFCTWVKKVC